VRRHQEQLSEEHAWYTAAEERYTAIKHSATEMDISHVISLTNEINLHTATVLDLRESIIKLNFDKVRAEHFVCTMHLINVQCLPLVLPSSIIHAYGCPKIVRGMFKV
jgi:hypothetical protein